jgi:hypothetical protein
MLALEN